MTRFVHSSKLAAPAREVFAWHERPGALVRLTPPWEHTELVSHEGIHDGGRAVLRVHVGPVARTWVAEHHDFVQDVQFVDRQIEGPFASWMHTHHFEALNGSACILEDRIEYELPLGRAGRLLAGHWTAHKLRRMFTYRHATLASDLERHLSAPRKPLTVVVSGASGLVGRALCAFLSTGGHTVRRLVRRAPREAGEFAWDPEAGRIADDALAGADAVVHLAGANVADGRWTDARKREIRDSRVRSTALLAATMANMAHPPAVWVSASAAGYYGNRHGEVDESSPPGDGFLADVCAEWEAAVEPARAAGVRVAQPRIGVVLTPAGGALAKMLPAFRIGVGAQIGDGQTPISWIGLDDLLGAIHFAIFQNGPRALSGPFNATAPEPVTMGELATALGQALHRPVPLRMPAAALRLALGEMADTVLDGARILPARLQAAGFRFHHPTLAQVLAHVLGGEGNAAPTTGTTPAQPGAHL